MNHFFALPLPEEIRQQLGKLAEDWRGMNQLHASWYAPADYHITLKFLGDVDPSRQAELIEAALPVVSQMGPFTIDLNSAPGAFPSLRMPRVLWAGAKENEPTALLAGCLESAMEPLGFRRERRQFKAHITLARCRDLTRDMGHETWTLGLPGKHAFPIFTADRFVLLQTLSQKDRVTKGRNGEKLRYNTVHTFPFGKASNDNIQ
ncbi:MAG TPA: RNA 2',3'-cyclic phosphodiesterase [Capsulimonadaceae bacterium]|nr:RNA 2',3'-cyclic phosphodiesterase [Capsulimonadaceae bacterium]